VVGARIDQERPRDIIDFDWDRQKPARQMTFAVRLETSQK
jgi:hypothetical protein